MIRCAIAFVAGAWSLQFCSHLPSLGWLVPAMALLGAAWYVRLARLPAAAALGFALALVTAYSHLHPALAPTAETDNGVLLVGEVVGLPDVSDRRVRFRFAVTRASVAGQAVEVPDTVRLSWYGAPQESVKPGQRWRVRARLKGPRGSRNPGGFDYERWLFREGIGATGYVRSEPKPQRLTRAWAPLDRARERLRRRIDGLTRDAKHTGILRALALGDRDAIDPATWDHLLATGTNHLVAISGLHIGLLAGVGFLVGGPIWRCIPALRRHLPRPIAQAVCALALASVYAALAGFALPTQRALVMLTVGLGAILWRRRARPAEGLALAAIAVVAFDPLAPLGPAFWLSFGAVAAILYVAAGRLGRPRRLPRWVHLQLAIGLVLVPILIVLFGRVSLIAPLVNLVAVPWVSVAVVPPTLVGAALAGPWPAAAEPVLAVADTAFTPLATLLRWSAALEIAQWHRPAPPAPVAALAGAATLLLLAPRGVPGRVAGAAMLVPLATWTPPRPGPGAVWLDVLDVGQGLAAVVRTAEHTLVYDTGPRYSPRFDAGEATVVPFLRQAGTQDLDKLIVSHSHADHAGGLDSVLRAYPDTSVFSGEPHRLERASAFCDAGRAWSWDGVRFRFVHPQRSDGFVANNASCVLSVTAPGGKILLPGDIEAPAERALLERWQSPGADVVVAPHHGSDTSSTPALVEAVSPRWVLYSSGWGNQWDLPHDAVIERWLPAGQARTDCGGALHVRITPGEGIQAPHAHRERSRRFWHAGCDGADKSGTMQAVLRPGAAARTGE